MKHSIPDMLRSIKIRRGIAAAVFIVIAVKSFLCCTYLFRNTTGGREQVVGLKEEAPLDMVYIGASDVYTYWQPLKAWDDYGFTSYDLAVDGVPAESIKYFIKETLRYHEPELFVISARTFQYSWEGGEEVYLRKSSDSLGFSIDRLKLIKEYLENRDMENVDELSLYLDIIKYHNNNSALATEANWNLMDNKTAAINKGFVCIPSYQYLTPLAFATDSRGELPEVGSKVLYEVLNFCKEKELNVLFIVCPYQITESQQAQFNSIGDIVLDYGFDFLNCNEYYDTIGIDFSRDFYHATHVNCYGAEKYTEFLSNYIMEHYNLADHRGEEIYTGWDEDFIRFTEEETDTKDKIDDLISAAEEGKEIAENIQKTTDLSEWCILAKDSRFTLLAAGDAELSGIKSEEEKRALALLGFDILENSSNYIRVLCDSNIIYSNLETHETEYQGIAGTNIGTNNITIKNSAEQRASIMVDGEECSRKESGINIVVYENDYNCVVDSITLKCDEEGKIELAR